MTQQELGKVLLLPKVHVIQESITLAVSLKGNARSQWDMAQK